MSLEPIEQYSSIRSSESSLHAAVIWDALKAACETDVQTARVILDSAGVVVASDDMSVCYDERGAETSSLAAEYGCKGSTLYASSHYNLA